MKTHTRKQNLKNKFNKLYFFILIMCITCISNAQNEGWHLLPFVPSQTLWDIHCINEDTVIAVGDKGYIIRTTNGGSYWDSIYSTTTNTLYKVTFVNDAVGYICGKNGTVLKTENSGLTWTNIGISTSLNLLSMSFINQDTGWIVGGDEIFPDFPFGSKGLLMKTLNGGQHWHVDTNNTSSVSSVHFLDNDTGYIALNNKDSNFLCKTTDGGLSYDTILRDVHVFSYKDIVFSNAQTGYFLKSINNGGIYKTDDYGLTWLTIVELYYPIFNIRIMDSCNLFYNYWDNTTGTSSLENTIIGINHCTNTKFDEVGLKNYGFNYSYLQIFEFDFINLNYGFCVGEGKKDGIDENFILKKGFYDNIRDFKKNNIVKIIPNPCNDKTILFFNSSLDLATLNIDIYNSLGQKTYSQIQINNNEIHVDLSKEKSGVYIVSIKDKNMIIQNCKLIKL
ncbi:MAG: Ycf48-like protein [Bacteroidetes bacterium ADurb.Bin234]|nr:MAG: Ycf48-like protein [Bacteroidetes bacterium ADurb.Bin234]